MTCEDVKRAIADYELGYLPEDTRLDFNAHIQSCSACSDEVRELSSVWRALGSLPQPVPSARLQSRFEGMLAAYEYGMQRGRQDSFFAKFREVLAKLWPKQPVWQMATAAVCLLAGFTGGRFVKPSGSPASEVSSLKGEVAAMRQLVTLSLLQQQSPSERLKGVSWSTQVEQPAPEVPAALLYAVGHDENVNVRLAAVDALRSFTNDHRIQQSLPAVLTKQDSPLVQIALVDLLSQVHDQEALNALQKLSDDANLDSAVRKRARMQLDRLRMQ